MRAYSARGSKYIDLKESVSKNTKKIYGGWEKTVYEFKNGILPLSKKYDMKADSSDQQPDIPGTSRQTKFIDFLDQIKEEQKNIDMKLFNRYFTYKTPDEMVQALCNSNSKTENNTILSPIMNNFDYFAKKTEEMLKDANK